eukprot:UN28978
MADSEVYIQRMISYVSREINRDEIEFVGFGEIAITVGVESGAVEVNGEVETSETNNNSSTENSNIVYLVVIIILGFCSLCLGAHWLFTSRKYINEDIIGETYTPKGRKDIHRFDSGMSDTTSTAWNTMFYIDDKANVLSESEGNETNKIQILSMLMST